MQLDTLVELLDESQRKFGSNPALLVKPTYKYLVWNYRQLWEASGQVAHWLQQQGVGKGDRVLLWGPNTPQWVMAFFGVVRAGAVAVPLDVRSAPDFVSRVSRLTEPSLALASRRSDTTPIGEVPVAHLEDLDQRVAGCPREPAPVDVGPDDLAEIMFTSGTTGDPKGVMLTHRNVVSNARAVSTIFVGRETDRILSLLPLSHMLEQCGGMLVPLLSGARIIYPVSRQPTFLFKAFQENKISLLLLVPQGLQLLMNGIEREVERQGKSGVWEKLHNIAPKLPMAARRRLFGAVHRRFGGGLRCVFSGGSFLDPILARKWENLGIPIVEGYGATEASPVVTFNPVSERVLGSVGKNLPGQKVRIAEDGEVLAAGPNITPGYWRNQQATDDSFEGEWYKTGDLGHLDEAGRLYLRGRKKDLIVLANGQNVYPEDIEQQLAAHPQVTDGVVVGMPGDTVGAETVHAVLLLDADGAKRPDIIRAIIEDVNSKLADHQRIASHSVWPDEDFPRTHTLKVKKALVLDHIKNAESPSAEPSPTPGSGPQQVDPLAQLVAQVAQVPAAMVVPERSLSGDLGLDSLGRVELLSLIEQELGVYLDESLLGPSTTFAELQRLVEERAGAGGRNMEFFQWPLTPWCTNVREAIHHTALFPFLTSRYHADVSGLEGLDELDGPVIFAINHNAIKLDSMLVLKMLPRSLRRRMTYAAAAEFSFRNRWIGVVVSLVANAFPIYREGGIRPSLEHLGSVLDRGWNVGIFPEGDQQVGQPMLPFQAGAGLLAVDGRVTVVPLRLVNHGRSKRGLTGNRESISVRVGKPLRFTPDTNYAEATQRIEEAVRTL
jgi:long-chain acyl-CoA synthetase